MKKKDLKILLVDDEPDILEIVGYNLSAEGYQVITAENGIEAIKKAKKHHPHLIILDVMMPEMDGIEACEKLRTSDAAEGMSFTEFTYQLVQGYDFLHLFRAHNCTLQMGGSDQWGNITTGTEMIRRIASGKGYALTCPLITKADGTKFGKTEGGNIWLDANRTSPYKFYQYWLNTSDDDAAKYIKIFTFLNKQEIDVLVEEHGQAPHLRNLQKRLADEITVMVHSKEELDNAVKASSILFGNSTSNDLKALTESTFLDVFEGVPQAEISKENILNGMDIIAALAENTRFLKSNSEARRALKENSISLNKEKVEEGYTLTDKDLINNKFILLQRGKKNYFLIKVV